MKELEKKKARKKQLQELLDKIKLSEQTRRNAAQQQQEEAEMITYERTFGKVFDRLLIRFIMTILIEFLLDCYLAQRIRSYSQ